MTRKRSRRALACLGRGAMGVALCLPLPVTHARAGSGPVLHDPACVEVVTGDVARVATLPRAGGGADVMLVLRIDIGDEVPVAVAPRWVVRARGLHLRAGDRVQVTGWRIVRGKPALLAAEIGAGGRTFLFRDRHGVPAWRRRHRLSGSRPAPTIMEAS